MRIIIGSRGSQLALWQANWVKERLTAAGYELEIKIIKTTGDKLANIPLTQSGTKGLFIKEIEEALVAEEVDLAVHSLKDLPTEQPERLTVAAVPEREDARDVLISKAGRGFSELPPGARVGTSSLRRQSQLRRLRADLEIVPMRGNLDTRLKKLDRGDCEAVVLAAAGVRRLGLADRITEYFSPEQLCSAVGQGALAIEIRADDQRMQKLVAPLDDSPTHRAVLAERAMLCHLGGGCQVPIAAHATLTSEQLRLVGVVGSLDGSEIVRASAFGPADEPEALGATVARSLLEQGARAILESVKI
ncbi:MAG TPA: hydroxymethylbilane synthase [Terriglobia bacterium]|nr:hydroxymethylbilane synthase [Terriglobia bacterium]